MKKVKIDKTPTFPQKWCMCTKEEITTVARDMKATCQNCGGADAYGGSDRRPESFKKDRI